MCPFLSFLMRYALGFSRASITVKVLCLLRVKYIFKYFKLFFPCFPCFPASLPGLPLLPSPVLLPLLPVLPSLALLPLPCLPPLARLPELVLLCFTLGANQKTLCGLLACLACALSCFSELPGLPAARLMSKRKKASVLPLALALILFAFSGLQPSI
jgi:hypothetical protein